MEKDTKIEYADLHIHTTFSDGMYTPEEVVRTAVELGFKAIAITDHDCIDGIPRALEAARETDLELVPGIEISTAIGDMEIHMLGYFIDWKDPDLVSRLDRMKENREKRMREIINNLRANGLNISEEDVFSPAAVGTIGRLHLANVMADLGIVKTPKEAFTRYIGDGMPCSVKHKRLEYTRAIDMIKGAGGVPVVGHPGIADIDRYIPDLVDAGVRGVEVYHTEHSRSDNEKYLKVAEKYSLIVTGGSDCHGMKKGRILMGGIKVDLDVIAKLKDEAARIRSEIS